MKPILLMAAMLLAFGVNAQDCKYDIDKPDPITGKPHKEIICKLARGCKAGFVNDAGTIYMNVFVIMGGEQRTVINEGDSLIVKLENGQIVNLTANAEVKPVAFIAGAGAYSNVASSYGCAYKCSAEDVKQLSESPIATMRMFFGTNAITLDDIKGKHGKHIMDAADCIRQ